jgi:hypothetical protein
MTSEVQPDATWSAFSDADAAAQISEMRQRFEALADLDQPAREQQAEAMIRAEYALDDEALPGFTESRLRSWLAMAGDNLERAQSVANAYERAFERVPGGIAMRRAALVQTVARDELTPEDIDVLYELIPRLVENVPRASQEAVERALSEARVASANERAAERSGSKPWWKFW